MKERIVLMLFVAGSVAYGVESAAAANAPPAVEHPAGNLGAGDDDLGVGDDLRPGHDEAVSDDAWSEHGAESADGAVEADNTGRNVRDRDPAALTPGDQSNEPPDLEITRAIRSSVVGDDTLSTNAHNVKIVTRGGVVTLRGPVESDAEKAKIEAAAEETKGVRRVDNRLEVIHDDSPS